MKTLYFYTLLILLAFSHATYANELKDLLALLDAPHGLNKLSEKNRATLKNINSDKDKYIDMLATYFDTAMLNKIAQSEATPDTHRFQVALLVLGQANTEAAHEQLNQWYLKLRELQANTPRRILLASLGTRPHKKLIDNILQDLPEMEAGMFFAAYEYLWHVTKDLPEVQAKIKQLLAQNQLPEHQVQYLKKISNPAVTN